MNALAVATEYVTLFPAVVALAWIVLGFLFVVRHEWRLPEDADSGLTVAAVIPAHNEELLIATAIESLLAQDHPGLEIHVVSDGSTDATVEIARRYTDRGVVVHELTVNVGKSGAMQYVLDRLATDLFMIVDADTACRPGAVRAMVSQFADPAVGAVTGHARVANVTNPLTAIQAMEYTVIVGLAKRAEQFWGGLYTVSGAAACFRIEALRAVGGWSVPTATEDIEVSWRLQRAGWRLAYEPRALFGVQAPTGWPALFRQRRRWARGMVEVARLHADFAVTPNRALIPIGVQVLGAATWMVVATALLGYALVTAVTAPQELTAIVSGEWASVLLWTLGLFGVQTAVATVFDSAYVSGGWRLVPWFVVFPIYFWLVIYPSFLAGAWQGLASTRTHTWARTERVVIPPR